MFARHSAGRIGLFLLLTAAMLVAGCYFPWEGQDKGLDSAYYRQVYMLPNGRFVGIEKIKGEATQKGLVYKAEMDEEKRLKEVVAVYNDKPINASWGLDIAGTPITLAKITITYEANGSMIYRFYSQNNKTVEWQMGAAAIRFKEIDKQGLPAKAEYLNGEMKPINNRGQALAAQFTYGDYNMLETMVLSGILKSGEDLQMKFYYDKNFIMHRLPIGMEITDVDGNLRPGFGNIARIIWQYDKQNRLIKKQFFGVDGELTNGNMFVNNLVPDRTNRIYERFCAFIDCVYDENQYYPSKITFYSADGELWKSYGSATIVPQPICKFDYDEAGNLSKVESEDSEGKAAELYSGIYALGYAYDDMGNLKECTFYNSEGQPALMEGKFAKWRQVYDTYRRVTEVAYFGVNDEKINAAIRETGKVHYFHRKVMERDSDGNIDQILYYNANDKRTK